MNAHIRRWLYYRAHNFENEDMFWYLNLLDLLMHSIADLGNVSFGLNQKYNHIFTSEENPLVKKVKVIKIN